METMFPGGINKTIYEIASNLSKNGHEVIVLQDNPFKLEEGTSCDGFKILRIKSRTANFLYGFSPEMYLYLKNNFKYLNPDLVHIHGYHSLLSPEILYLIRNFDRNIPIVFSPHYGVFSHSTLAGKYLWGTYNRIVANKFIKHADMIICSSKFELDNFNKVSNSLIETRVINHGINHIDLEQERYNHKGVNLLYVGHLLEVKGVQYILEALHELIFNLNIKATLTVIGEGPYKYKLMQLMDKLDIVNYVTWKDFIPLDKQKELLECYKKSDVLLLLSKSENFGIVVAESLAMGTPTIITKRTALMEFLDEKGCFGVDYPPNPKEVASAVLKIHRNNIRVDSLSNKIRLWKEVALDYEQVYLDLLMKESLKCR